MDKLEVYAALLGRWNEKVNLVSKGSLEGLWRRHILDCAQLVQFIPQSARTLVDLGSGAGLPGLILAIVLGPRISTTLIEATTKKCRFLEAAASELALDVEVRNERIEDARPRPFHVVTARACAPLSELLAYAKPFVGKDSVVLFLKGQNVGSELTAASNCWRMDLVQHPSASDPTGRIVEVREFSAK